jgi:hypothetical protein
VTRSKVQRGCLGLAGRARRLNRRPVRFRNLSSDDTVEQDVVERPLELM